MTPDQLMVRMLLSPEKVGRSLAAGDTAMPRRHPAGRPVRQRMRRRWRSLVRVATGSVATRPVTAER